MNNVLYVHCPTHLIEAINYTSHVGWCCLRQEFLEFFFTYEWSFFFRPNESSNSKRSSEVVRCYKVKEQRANLVEHVVVLITDRSIRQSCANPSLFLCFNSSPLRFLWCWHDGRSAVSTGESWVGNSRARYWSNFPRKNHRKKTAGWPGRWIPSHVEPGKDVSFDRELVCLSRFSWNF